MDNARPALTWHDHAPMAGPDCAVAEGGELPTSIVAVERALENLSRQIREAQPWDAQPAALRRFRWLLKAVRIQRNASSLAAALQDRADDLPDDAARPLLNEADRLWELTDPLTSLINELVTGADAHAELAEAERLLIEAQ